VLEASVGAPSPRTATGSTRERDDDADLVVAARTAENA
jgi:hypothetical protein